MPRNIMFTEHDTLNLQVQTTESMGMQKICNNDIIGDEDKNNIPDKTLQTNR